MLEYLHVKNLALIKDVELEFSDNLNILSGETGAGKSILLGSINLCLGMRADTSLIRTGESFAYVELVFHVTEKHVLDLLSEMDLSLEDERLIISRKIQEGKSVSKINGETVTSKDLKRITETLIDIHGQHEHQSLLNEDHHIEVLDSFGNEKLLEKRKIYESYYKAYKKKREEVNSFGGDDEKRKRQIDFLKFQIDEISDASLKIGEEESLLEESKILQKTSVIKEGLNEILSLRESEGRERISSALKTAMNLSQIDESLKSLFNELSDIDALLSDVTSDAEEKLDEFDMNEERREEVEERLSLIRSLEKKYGPTINDILKSYKAFQKEYEELVNFDENKERILLELQEEKKKLIKASKELHEVRLEISKDFAKRMEEILLDLNFLHVKFEVSIEETNRYTSYGSDHVSFMISTNPGEPVKPLVKVASGGELSRIMLAIKTLTSESDQIHTLIFDEIDTGISGKTAKAVAILMGKISVNHQVLCISHLPQIVAMADHHYLIEKSATSDETVTEINKLDEESSVKELARLLAAGELTDRSIENAREMKKLLRENT